MKPHFRCHEPTGACQQAQSGELFTEEGFQCPHGDPNCQLHRQPVSWPLAIWQRHGWPLRIGAAAVALLFMMLLFAGGGHSECQQAQEELASELEALAQRALTLVDRARTLPPPPSTEALLEEGEALRSQATALAQPLLQAAVPSPVTIEMIAQRDQTVAQIKEMKRKLERLIQRAVEPSSEQVDSMMAANRWLRDYEQAEERIDQLMIRFSHPSDAECRELLANQLEAMHNHAHQIRILASWGATRELPPEFTAMLAELEQLIRELKKIKPPEPEPELKISSSPSLTESLVIPLAKAFWNAQVESYGENQWFLRTEGTAIDPGLLVIATETDPYNPYHALIDQSVDLVITNRAMNEENRNRFAAAFGGASIDSSAYSAVVGLDAIVLLTHPDNPSTSLTRNNLSRIRWLIRQADQSEITALLPTASVSTSPVENPFHAVIASPYGNAMAFFHQSSRRSLRAQYLAYAPTAESRKLAPSPFSISTEDYQLSLRILATHRPDAQDAVYQFVAYMLSPAGQSMVSDQGFVDLRLYRQPQERLDPLISSTLSRALGLESFSSATRYSTNLRFGVNEATLDIRAQADIIRLSQDLSQGSGKVVILGFTDNVGGPEVNHPLSIRRAEFIAQRLSRYGITTTAAGMGAQLPIDSNESEEGRARNRRAEVWVVEP